MTNFNVVSVAHGFDEGALSRAGCAWSERVWLAARHGVERRFHYP